MTRYTRKHFAAHLRDLVAGNHLPDYAVTLESEQAVFWRREQPAKMKGRSGSAAQVHTSNQVLISSEAIEQLADVAPRWDKHMLERMYIDWAGSKEPARNEDARFLGWVRSYTKGKPAE